MKNEKFSSFFYIIFSLFLAVLCLLRRISWNFCRFRLHFAFILLSLQFFFLHFSHNSNSLSFGNSQHISLLWIVVFFFFCGIINDAFYAANEPLHYLWNLILNLFFSLSQDTELLVLGCLKWDVSCVTPHDFIDLLIARLPIINKLCADIDPDKIRKHSQAFISLAARGEF